MGKDKEEVKSCEHTQSTRVSLLAIDLHLELDIIHHRASLKLQQLNAGQAQCHSVYPLVIKELISLLPTLGLVQFCIDKNCNIS